MRPGFEYTYISSYQFAPEREDQEEQGFSCSKKQASSRRSVSNNNYYTFFIITIVVIVVVLMVLILSFYRKTQLTFLLKTNQIHITMYNFGSPRVGNKMFHSLYKHHVVDSFRVQVDGDVIPGTPISDAINQYEHHGSEVLIDGLDASGSIIINPTSIELRLRARAKTSVTGHSTVTYLKGLAAIVDSVNQHSEDDVDVDCGDGIKVEDVTVAVLAKYDSVRSTDKSGSNMFKFRGKEETKSTPLPSTDPEPSSPSIEFEIDHHDSTFGVRSFEIDE